MDGEEYQEQSEDNFVQQLRITSVRGLVLDRKRRPMGENRPTYNAYLTPRFTNEESVERLILELSLKPEQAETLASKVRSAKGKRRYQQLLVKRDISRDQLARLETHRLDGVSIQARAQRSYSHGNLSAHMLGYMNEVTGDELKKVRFKDYRPGDMTGRAGVERMFEDQLRGVPGSERIVVDARGRRKRGPQVEELLGKERRVEPSPGHNIVLTVDIEVQRLVERAMRRYSSGAAVVMEVNTGRILASASKPAYDPNLLTSRLNPKDARRLLTDPMHPLLDRVTREHYYPGSTYKVVTATAALEEGKVKPSEKLFCKGYHRLGKRNFRCSHSHLKVDLQESIVGSCNVYYYTMAERVGMDTLARYARMYGLGAPTGLGLNGEVGGFIPTKAWYARRKQPFRVGFTLNAGIGQGNVKTTPLQIVSMYAAIANGGTLYLPQVVERVETSSGKLVEQFTPRARRRVKVKDETFALIRKGLEGVVSHEDGTAYGSRLKTINVAGKTGTAQVGRRSKKGSTVWLGDHSWFAAYAPVEDPLIAVAVIIEHGGRAAKVAAPVVMEIIKGYFRYVEPNAVTSKAPAKVMTPPPEVSP
jgi:penicillin-binding protein 2